jgi:hypothetical protein
MPVKNFKKYFTKQTAAILVAIGLVLLVATGAYATHFFRSPARHIPSRVSRNVSAIQDWMTVRYVARAYGIPEQMLIDHLSITSQQANHQSIKSLAKLQNKDPLQLLEDVRSFVQHYQETQ